MSNPTEFTYKGRKALYWSVSGLRELTEKNPGYVKSQEKEGHAWFTVHHRESDWSEPSYIARGAKLVNRMGFIYAPSDFIEGDGLEFKSRCKAALRELRDEIMEMESVS